ncbi:zinc finger protein 62-like [Gigantopelta aegis]|uniref:zinc finger protein 62-like n=1 Tax=Gigantopelta aegis TaxID=1735272 RepID=UPI001B88D8C4|nr:zinc finger protein 62-like [Gigantopelta aegis]
MNSDIGGIDSLCNDSFKTDCSNKVVLSKSVAMQVQNGKCIVDHQNNSFAALSQQAINQGHVGSGECDQLLSSGKENSVHGTESVSNTAINHSTCASDEGSDVASSQDVYDKNSWILYGDSQVSAKNSWVLYGNSQSPPIDKSRGVANVIQNDNISLVSTNVEERLDTFDGNVTDSVSQLMTRDKESAYEDQFSESRPHACSVCCKRFKLSHHLKEHMRIHTGEKPFPCSICGEKFSRSHLLRAHQARHAQESFPSVGTIFPCSKCMKIFESPQHLARHEKNHKQLKILKCDVCNKQFTHQVLLNRHKLQHATSNSDSAGKCPEVVIKQELDDKDSPDLDLPKDESPDGCKKDLQDSRNVCVSSHSEQVITKENKPQSNSVSDDERKIKSTENKPPVSSDKKAVFDQGSWVLYGEDRNAKRVTAKEEPPHMDTTESDRSTPSVYKGIDLAKLHELYLATNRSLFNRNGLMSPFYGMFGFHRHALMSLIDQTAMNNSSSPLSYNTGQNFKSDSPLEGGSRPHQCPHCSKRFKLSHHLREHLRIHTGEKPYQCDVCHERFSRSHLLQRHKTKHVSDYAFNQVTDWIEKTSTNCCDYDEMSDHISMPYDDKPGTESITDVCIDKPATVISSSMTSELTSIPNYNSHCSGHKQKEESVIYTSDLGSEQVLKLGDEQKAQREHKENTTSGSEPPQSYQCINNAGDKAVSTSPGINITADSTVRISGIDSTSDSIESHSSVGISGAFQKSICTGISETDHKSSFADAGLSVGNKSDIMDGVSAMESGNDEPECTSESFLRVSKRNLRSNSIVRFSGKDSSSDSMDTLLEMDQQPDSMGKSGSFSTNSYTYNQQNHSDGERHTTGSNGYISKQTGESPNRQKQGNDEQDTKMFYAVKSKPRDEHLVHSGVKLETSLPVSVQTKASSELPVPNCTSTFQLNQSLLNNNINMFNMEYLNYAQNVHQAIASGGFRGYHDGDSLPLDIPLDIPPGDLHQDAFLSPLEYSNVFRSRQGGFMRCELCGKLFADMNNLRQHMVSHSMDRQFSCHLCEKKFKRPHHLKEHMRIHTGEKPYVCDICDEKFSRSHILQRHRMKHNAPMLNDSYVQNILHNICKQNRRTRSPEFVYDKFSSQDAGQGDSAPIPASSDSDSDSKPPSRAPAAANESDVTDCDVRNVKRWHAFDKGYSQDFSKSVLQTFVCRECGKRFANSSNLKQHMVSHFPDRLFPCSVCNKKFKRPHHLKEHSRTHTGEKPFECSRCGERFQRSHLLMKHKEKHHSQYAYSVDFSAGAGARAGPSAVRVNGYLNKQKTDPHEVAMLPDADKSTGILSHSETHKTDDADSDKEDLSGGEGAFCNICNKEFPSEILLTVHKRTHPGDRPHQCGHCGKQFALQYLLEVHEKSCSQV